jgi:hypothetical protein
LANQPAAYCRFDISARLGSEHHEFAAATTTEGIGIAVANPPNLVEYLEGRNATGEFFTGFLSLRQILDNIISEAKLWHDAGKSELMCRPREPDSASLGPSLRRRASLRSSEVALYFIEFGSTYNTVAKLFSVKITLESIKI